MPLKEVIQTSADRYADSDELHETDAYLGENMQPETVPVGHRYRRFLLRLEPRRLAMRSAKSIPLACA